MKLDELNDAQIILDDDSSVCEEILPANEEVPNLSRVSHVQREHIGQFEQDHYASSPPNNDLHLAVPASQEPIREESEIIDLTISDPEVSSQSSSFFRHRQHPHLSHMRNTPCEYCLLFFSYRF